MKQFFRLIFIAAMLLPIGLQANAQTVYSVDYKSDADVKVFVTDYKSDADLIVYKAGYKSDATGNNGIWYFVNYKSDAKRRSILSNISRMPTLSSIFPSINQMQDGAIILKSI